MIAEDGPLKGNLSWKFLPAPDEVPGEERPDTPEIPETQEPVWIDGGIYNDRVATTEGEPWPRGTLWTRDIEIGVPMQITFETTFPDLSIGLGFRNTEYDFKVFYPDASTGKEDREVKLRVKGPQVIHVEAAPRPGEALSMATVEITPISGPLKAGFRRSLMPVK